MMKMMQKIRRKETEKFGIFPKNVFKSKKSDRKVISVKHFFLC